jgi:hypothetical protein
LVFSGKETVSQPAMEKTRLTATNILTQFLGLISTLPLGGLDLSPDIAAS